MGLWQQQQEQRSFIVHGVEEFFDLAFQTLLYSWYNGSNNKNNREIERTVSSNLGSGASLVKDMVMGKLLIIMAAVAFAGTCLSLAWVYQGSRRHSEYGPIRTEEVY
ncbi:hypothetical protein RHSIM_Rhsim01G0027400 [Rhododendron simsii]|uniref:Uncharacterized protein n=1 Tax=Rhododendron simsii TaxID=118357 RepID=A0A834LYH4_RHOSS|nr:hypothetical protein RHSIM_Rhsim01G0027400 [Rhododendron simsii]